MSTSTGPAYKIKQGTDLFFIGMSLDTVREAQNLGYTRNLYDYLVTSFDESDLDENKTFEQFVQETFTGFENDWANNTEKNSEYTSLRLKLKPSFVFHHNPVRNEVYVRLIDFTDEAIEAFSKLDFVEKNMEYYNASDSQLNRMTEEEWHDLRDAWDEASTRNKPVSSTLKMALVNPVYQAYFMVTIKNLREHWDKIEQVSLNTRHSRVFATKYLKHYFANLPVNANQFPWHVIFDTKKYNFEKNNVQDLPNWEENLNIIEQLREETVEWVENHPISL